jgi:hypothetical protein
MEPPASPEGEYFFAFFCCNRGYNQSPRVVDQSLPSPEDIMVFFSLAKKYS